MPRPRCDARSGKRRSTLATAARVPTTSSGAKPRSRPMVSRPKSNAGTDGPGTGGGEHAPRAATSPHASAAAARAREHGVAAEGRAGSRATSKIVGAGVGVRPERRAARLRGRLDRDAFFRADRVAERAPAVVQPSAAQRSELAIAIAGRGSRRAGQRCRSRRRSPRAASRVQRRWRKGSSAPANSSRLRSVAAADRIGVVGVAREQRRPPAIVRVGDAASRAARDRPPTPRRPRRRDGRARRSSPCRRRPASHRRRSRPPASSRWARASERAVLAQHRWPRPGRLPPPDDAAGLPHPARARRECDGRPRVTWNRRHREQVVPVDRVADVGQRCRRRDSSGNCAPPAVSVTWLHLRRSRRRRRRR